MYKAQAKPLDLGAVLRDYLAKSSAQPPVLMWQRIIVDQAVRLGVLDAGFLRHPGRNGQQPMNTGAKVQACRSTHIEQFMASKLARGTRQQPFPEL